MSRSRDRPVGCSRVALLRLDVTSVTPLQRGGRA
jgi:hypothetical protein